MVDITQLRMAKAALNWSFKEWSKQTSLTPLALQNICKGESTPRKKTLGIIVSIFEAHNIEFIENGVRVAPKTIEIIEGQDCYIKTLDKALLELANSEDKELLIMFASDAASPPIVNERYRIMRQYGISMRQLIKEGDTYIIGELEEYRTIPEELFINIVSLVFGDCVAQVNGNETAVTIHRDAKLATQKRAEFKERWQSGNMPTLSTAEERF